MAESITGAVERNHQVIFAKNTDTCRQTVVKKIKVEFHPSHPLCFLLLSARPTNQTNQRRVSIGVTRERCENAAVCLPQTRK